MSFIVSIATALLGMTLLAQSPAEADGPWLAQTSGAGEAGAKTMTVRGTVAVVDKENRTVTLKGPRGHMLLLDVKDPQKLDMIKVGDPVVATYTEAVAFQIKKPGTATPGVTTRETAVGSKPGENPSAAIGGEVTVTGTITAIDKNTNTVTLKGPQGNSTTFKAKDPNNLDLVKVGDLVEVTYTKALAVSLDKAPK